MIYTDKKHVVADDLIELHLFMNSLGISNRWFEGVRKGHPHYDIPKKYLNRVLSKEVKIVSSREILKLSKQMVEDKTMKTRENQDERP